MRMISEKENVQQWLNNLSVITEKFRKQTSWTKETFVTYIARSRL